MSLDSRGVTANGQLVSLPRGVDHGYRAGAEPLRHLNLVQPAGFEQFFADAGARVDDARMASDPAGLAVVANHYGVTLLGPASP